MSHDGVAAVGEIHTFAGNESPIITTSGCETQHAGFTNGLKGKWWNTGIDKVVEGTSLSRWRGVVPHRVAEERLRIHEAMHGADESIQRKRLNQYLAWLQMRCSLFRFIAHRLPTLAHRPSSVQSNKK